MRYLCIYCEVLEDQIMKAAQNVPFDLIFEKIPKHLHTEPMQVKEKLFEIIKKADRLPSYEKSEKDGINGIILGLALCGGAAEGIISKCHSIIIPRAHDCISLFLGSKNKYSDLYREYEGKAYWFTPSFLKQDFLPTPKHFKKLKEEYVRKFDEDSADYLIETELEALKQYKVLAKVDNLKNPDSNLSEAVNSSLKAYGWSLKEHNTDMRLFDKLLNTNWDDDFLIVPPKHKIVQTHNDDIIGYIKQEDAD